MSNHLAALRAQRGVESVDPAPAPITLAVAVPADDGAQQALRRVIGRLSAEAQGLDLAAQRQLCHSLVAEETTALSRAEREAVEREVLENLGGRLGPLQSLLDDPEVTEIMVNRPDQVFVERQGRLEACPVTFRDDRSVQALVERIVGPLGRSFSLAQPTVDARLPDGSRLNAVRPPISLLGTSMTIRRFPRPFSLRELVEAGGFGPAAWVEPNESTACPVGAPPWTMLAWAVRQRANLVVAGGTGTGKTTMLNALTGCIPASERVVCIEDAAELQPRLPHVVRLEARPANTEGTGQVTIQQLVVNALRMRPDRIVVGEVRDMEALDMLVAMNTGHDGSLTTVHANSPREVFHRLVQATTLRRGSGEGDAIVQIAADALKLIVQMVRDSGRRRVHALVAVEGVGADGQPRLRALYRWEGGALRATGERPAWAEA